MVKVLFAGCLGALLAGCASSPQMAESNAGRGYVYHDANHTNPASQSASPTTSASHGTWLWSPAENDWP